MTFMVSLRFNIEQFHISFSGKRCTMLSKKWPGQYQILLYQPNWPPCVDQYTLCVNFRSHCVFFNQLVPPRWPKNQLCSKGVCGARTSSLLVTSYAQLGNFHHQFFTSVLMASTSASHTNNQALLNIVITSQFSLKNTYICLFFNRWYI